MAIALPQAISDREAFSSVKRVYGPAVRAKSPDAMFNEVLLKCLAHNLSRLVHAIHELGIEPKLLGQPDKVTT